MAPTLLDTVGEIAKRDYYGSGGCPSGTYRSGNYCYQNSRWNQWGRWVALILIVLFFAFVFFILSCFNARRRRKRGLSPRYGTGWLGGKPGTYNNNNNNNNNGDAYNNAYNNPTAQAGGYDPNFQPVPPYSPPHAQSYNQNNGYYGQQSGIELQQPQQAYYPGNEGSNQYAPPPAPPPGKGGYGNDGVIR